MLPRVPSARLADSLRLCSIDAMADWSTLYASYRLGDWLSIVALLVSYVVLFFVPPHHRLVTSSSDPALSYPHTTETVSAALLFFFAVGVPLLVFLVFFWLRRGAAHVKSEYHNLVLAFLLCIIVDLLVTDSIKKITGRPRPNFFALTGWQQSAEGEWGPGPDASASDVREAYQSFVSGHTSLSFAGLLFLAQFLFQQLSPLSPLHIAHSLTVDRKRLSQLSRINNLPSLLLPALPLALAVWIGLTRIVDYWHFCEDVLGGALVGSLLATITFNYCYLERRWTWLNIHPAPGAEGFISPSGGGLSDGDEYNSTLTGGSVAYQGKEGGSGSVGSDLV